MSRISPSISLDFRTSWVRVLRTASSRSRKPRAFHPADEPPLPVTHRRKLVCQPVLIPAEPGPIVSFVDVHCYSPHSLRK